MAIYQKIFNLIQQAHRILLVSHKNCGDATGSLLAFIYWLEKLGKKYSAFLEVKVPHAFQFLVGMEKIVHILKNFQIFDLILILDCGDLKQTGLEKELKPLLEKRSVPFINIDHHLTNQNFGTVNLVQKEKAATSEIIYDFFRLSNIEIDKNIATALLLGILQDTDGFTNPATSPSAFQVSAELLLKRAQFKELIRESFQNHSSVATLKLWGRALARLRKNNQLNLATTFITLEDLREYQVGEEASEGLANFLNHLAGVKGSLILKEQADGTIKGSLRTTRNLLDVSKLAIVLGGGGHRKAAGFTIKGRLIQQKDGWRIV